MPHGNNINNDVNNTDVSSITLYLSKRTPRKKDLIFILVTDRVRINCWTHPKINIVSRKVTDD